MADTFTDYSSFLSDGVLDNVQKAVSHIPIKFRSPRRTDILAEPCPCDGCQYRQRCAESDPDINVGCMAFSEYSRSHFKVGRWRPENVGKFRNNARLVVS